MALQPWSPTVDQVGALLTQRTRTATGEELGTFSTETRPTDTQVADLIEQATDDVADAVGADIPTETYDRAASLVAIGAAMLVELSFYPDMVSAQRSPYPALKTLYDDRLPRLKTQVDAIGGEVEPGDAAMMPAASFGPATVAGGLMGPNPLVYGAPVAPFGPEGFGPYWGGSVTGLPW